MLGSRRTGGEVHGGRSGFRIGALWHVVQRSCPPHRRAVAVARADTVAQMIGNFLAEPPRSTAGSWWCGSARWTAAAPLGVDPPSGRVRWQYPPQPGPLSWQHTSTADGGIVAVGGRGALVVLDRRDGTLHWSQPSRGRGMPK